LVRIGIGKVPDPSDRRCASHANREVKTDCGFGLLGKLQATVGQFAFLRLR
jgi:hypothetical protein